MKITLHSPRQLGDLLRSRRKQRAVSQAAVAARLGVSQERVSAIERAPGHMSLAQFIAIADLLELSVEITARPPMPGTAAPREAAGADAPPASDPAPRPDPDPGPDIDPDAKAGTGLDPTTDAGG